MPLKEPPTGIIRTLPAFYGNPAHEACKNYRAAIERMAVDEDAHWFALLPSVPRHADLLHIYIVICGRIDHRFTLAGFRKTDRETRLWDGTPAKAGSAWAICAGPAVKPPHEIRKQGFRGFQYTEPLW